MISSRSPKWNGRARRMGPPEPDHIRSLAALDAVEGFGPGLVIDAGPAVAAILDRRLPEVELVEKIDAVGGAAAVAQQLLALAGRRHRRDAAEPGRDIGLGLRLQRVLEP